MLRSIGFTRGRIKALYFYEALILVLASCLLGVMIGVIVGYTMALQQAVFNALPLKFFFPWMQFGVVMGMTLLCAFVATWGPAGRLVKKEISAIFRSGA